MAITVVFDPPLPTDPPATFDSKAFTALGDLNDWSTQANAVANQINGAQPNLDIVAGNIANINAAVADLPALSAKVSKTGDTMTGNLNVPSINGGQLAGMRNKIINGAFAVNQRSYVSGAATTAGQYTLDRWKVTGTGGITFSTTANKTTVTIPSGQTLQQVIEGLNLQTGTYVLSWEGTAQGRIDGGSYGASGAVTASITGGTNTTIEFNAGTVANVQLEIGTIATPFEWRFNEMQLCRRYCLDLVDPPFRGLVLAGVGPAGLGFLLPVEMAAPPSITVVSSFGITDGAAGSGTVTGVDSSSNTKNTISFTPVYTVISPFSTAGFPVIMNTGSSGRIRLTAEL